MKITRASIAEQMRDYCAAHWLTFEVGRSPEDAQSYTVGGESLTRGAAADNYLPGGFAGSFGRKATHVKYTAAWQERHENAGGTSSAYPAGERHGAAQRRPGIQAAAS